MTTAIDFSDARPTPAAVAAAGVSGVIVYTGPARPDKPYLDAMRAAGLTVALVQESDPNRSQQGYAAGVADAQYANSRADEVGYPSSCAIAFVVSDGNATDPSTGADAISAYAKGVKDTSARPFFWYGNTYATSAAMAGGGGLGTWIPSSWGNGTLLSQEANIASPIADSDLNTIHAPYGAWGQAGPTPGDDEVAKPLYISKQSDSATGIWATDGVWKRHVNPDEWAFAKFVDPSLNPLPLTDSWWDSLITAK